MLSVSASRPDQSFIPHSSVIEIMTRYPEALRLTVVLCLITLACLPFLLIGPQNGHSYVLNLSWSHGFTNQFLAGELYPRWILNLNAGAGSPVFFVYAPVPFYIISAGELTCLDCTPAIQLAIGEWMLILFSGCAFYVYARSLGGATAAAVGSLLYALLPYHFTMDLLTRQAVGETAAYIWMPLVMLFADRINRGATAAAGLAVTYALLILTHLPSTLIFSIFLVPYVAERAYSRKSPHEIVWFCVGIVCGIALSGVYLIPSLLLLDSISSHVFWTGTYSYDRWFFFDGLESPESKFSDTLFAMLALSTSAYLLMYLGISPDADRGTRRRLRVFMGMVAGAWFLMSAASSFLWELIPVLQKVQFPWRMAIIIDFAIAATTVIAISGLSTKGSHPARVFGAILTLLVLSSSAGGYIYWFNSVLAGDEVYQSGIDEFFSIGFDGAEYLPPDIALRQFEAWEVLKHTDMVQHDANNGNIRVARWEARNIAFDVDLKSETEVTVRQFYFPGWRATVSADDTELAVSATDELRLVTVIAPPGRYRIELKLGTLWQESLGYIVSSIGLIWLVALLAVGFYRSGWRSRLSGLRLPART